MQLTLQFDTLFILDYHVIYIYKRTRHTLNAVHTLDAVLTT